MSKQKLDILAMGLGLLILASTAYADTKILQRETSEISAVGGAEPSRDTAEVTLWVRADRATRVDANGRLISRIDQRKAYVVRDADSTYTVLEMGDAPPSAPSGTKLVKSGEKRRIGSWNAERYDMDVAFGPEDKGHLTLWMSDEVDVDMRSYRAFSEAVAAQGLDFMRAVLELDGYPVLQEMQVGVVKMTVELVSIEEAAPPAGIYDLPAGYSRRP